MTSLRATAGRPRRPKPRPARTTPRPPGDAFFLEIAAENTEYDVSELGPAPAGEDITLQFDNDDPGIQHNWSLYETEDSRRPIFEGEILTGVDTQDYEFTGH